MAQGIAISLLQTCVVAILTKQAGYNTLGAYRCKLAFLQEALGLALPAQGLIALHLLSQPLVGQGLRRYHCVSTSTSP